jgi:hypothetical protein
MLSGKLAAMLALLAGIAWTPPSVLANAAPSTAAQPPAMTKPASTSTADHSKFKELQQTFKTGPEVTRACLACHTEAAKQVHKSKHWTWEFLNPDTHQRLGKKNTINNFCTAIPSNYEFCTACHVGYGWKDQNFDFAAQENVDCLVCHDTTGTYRKLPGLSGHPPYQDMEYPPHSGKIVKAPDLKAVAQGVGKTGRQNCGACHFYGGGGDAVKHGDLDSSLRNPGRYLDVHMAKDGLNFSCGECHKTTGHEVPGSRYAPTAGNEKADAHMRGKPDGNPATCQALPHERAAQAECPSEHACREDRLPDLPYSGIRARPTDQNDVGLVDRRQAGQGRQALQAEGPGRP